jgi:hypothetical protein
MQRLLGVFFAVLLSFAACPQRLPAQPGAIIDFPDPLAHAIEECVAKRGEAFRAYCRCWINHWVGLWTEEDRVKATRTGVATEHMQKMEAVAAKQCGGG